jgi:hypothetical protein
MNTVPAWLRWLERRASWLAIPNIALLIVTLQALGFFMVMSDPEWAMRLALLPDAVLRSGEWWRLITFLALPISQDPFWVILALWFLWFLLGTIESEWGAFRTTFYVLVSVLLTIGYSLGTGYPVTQVGHFESTLFLAAALLYPEMEIRIFFVIPAKMKWLAWITGALAAWAFLKGGRMDRAYLAVVYSNFLLFFGPVLLGTVRAAIRRSVYRRKLRD